MYEIRFMYKQLRRSRQQRVIGGVCGGLGDYFHIDPIIFRFAFIALLLAGGSSLFIYLLLLIVVPKEEFSFDKIPGQSSGLSIQDSGIKKPEPAENSDSDTRMIFGLLLISAGVLFLLNNLVPYFRLEKLWPAVLVIMGLGLLLQKKPGEKKTGNEN